MCRRQSSQCIRVGHINSGILMLMLSVVLLLAVDDSEIFPGNYMLGSMGNIQESCHCCMLGSMLGSSST